MKHYKTVALLGLLSALLMVASYSLVGGTGGAILGIGLAAVMNLGSWYYSDRIALAAYGAKPVSPTQAPKLHRIVQRLCDRANLPMPDIYIVESHAANAFATGRNPDHAAIAVTQGILRLLPADELEGVIAHELSHIYNRDTLTQAIAATIAGAISLLANIFSYTLWFGGLSRDNENGNGLGMLFTILLAPIAATVIQLGLSRTREFAADEGAARLTGNPRALARALQRLEESAQQRPMQGNPSFAPLLIVNNLKAKNFASLFSTHPKTESRIERLLNLESQLNRPSQQLGMIR